MLDLFHTLINKINFLAGDGDIDLRPLGEWFSRLIQQILIPVYLCTGVGGTALFIFESIMIGINRGKPAKRKKHVKGLIWVIAAVILVFIAEYILDIVTKGVGAPNSLINLLQIWM